MTSRRTKKILDLAAESYKDPGPSTSQQSPYQIPALPSQAPQSSPPQAPTSPTPQTPPSSFQQSPSSPPIPPPAYQTGTYYVSSSESEPYQDSGDSYKPSDNEAESESTLSGASNLASDDEIEDHSSPREDEVPGEADAWGPCEDFPRNFQFSGQHGLKVNHLDLSQPYDIYKQFLTNEILDKIVLETNRYASHLIQSKPLPRRSLLHKWTDTNRAEIEKLIGILMIMGINKLPQMRLYWSNNDMYSNERIKNTMTRNRFDMLLRCLHFSDNSDPNAENDRLFKIRNIIELCCKQFQETLEPAEELVIDESMVTWRGRLVFRQYLPAKSHKYGVKVYKICTPEGYTYDLIVYAGKNDPTGTATAKANGHTYNICMELLEKVINSGRIIYMDNYYTSVKLCKDLLERKTYICRTLRSNRRGNPRDVCSKKLKKGEIFSQQNKDNIRVTKWLDKRPVLMISSVPNHTDQLVATGTKNK
ncbi:hypothetical protein NQ314_016224 [Rhamnusium bicolor]|uniref:PiggyBac transposable element-derived protein domain-containing protein n=1 Tax=Rhamnusium bicolor TaxID=1586634 RepID=A0AAV8WWE5_9CUCU|nr:hypothetical protein NQ314_016224 [Rhamnusium bicolor]